MPTYQADGAQLYYDDIGSGDPLLLVHGAAASGRWFDAITPELAQRHRLVVPDMRGLGRSERVAPLSRPEVLIDDILALLDHLELSQVGVLGVSLGSRIAGRLALAAPHRVAYLIVDAPIVGMSRSGSSSLNTTFATVEPQSPQALEWQRLHGEDWADAVAYYAQTRSTEAFQRYLTLEGELAGIPVPTLICRGDRDDPIHPVANAFTWHAESRDSWLWIAPGLSQSSTIDERPDQFVAVVRDFVEQRKLSVPA